MRAVSLEQPAPFRPWLSMWFHPRQTIQRIIDTSPLRGIIVLVLLSGIAAGVGDWLNAVVTDTDTFQEVFLLSAVYGLVFRTTALFAGSLVLQWIASRGARCVPYSHFVAGNLWGTIPNIGFLLLFGVMFVFSVLTSLLFGPVAGALTLVNGLLAFAWSVAEIWSLVLIIGALSQVMKCSVGSALGRQILAGVILIAPMWALSGLFFYFLGDDTGGDIALYRVPGAETGPDPNALLIRVIVLLVTPVVLFAMYRSARARQASTLEENL